MTLQLTENELKWLELILYERFGQKFTLSKSQNIVKMTLKNHQGAIIFDKNCNDFGLVKIGNWSPSDEGWMGSISSSLPTPGVRWVSCPLIEQIDGCYFVHYNIVELIYWMLARVEELENDTVDIHGRFPGAASHAHQCGYLDRPIVDEWLHILRQVISRQWPSINLHIHTSKTLVTCDVDSPFEHLDPLYHYARSIGQDLLRRYSIVSAMRRLTGRILVHGGNYCLDSHWRGIQYIMELNEKLGNTVDFNFIPMITDKRYDITTDIDNIHVQKLIKEISERGHKIGVHPGYNSFNDPQTMQNSLKRFKTVLDQLNIMPEHLSSRQHFLRWDSAITPRLLSDNGVSYDTSLGYADMPGFRCGTCIEYTMFDVLNQKILPIVQRPLILMECSVISPQYMGLGYSEEALSVMLNLRDNCRNVSGQFTVLWHNSHLQCNDDKIFLERLLTP